VIGLTASTLSAQVTTTWTGLGDGTNFFDTLNWNNGVPGFNDTAVFDGAASDGFTINFDQADISIDSLIIQNMVETGPIFSGASGFFVNTDVFADAFEINSNGPTTQDVAVGGQFDINSNIGTQFVNRTIINNSVFSIAGSGGLHLTGTTIDNGGALVIDSPTSIVNNGLSQINNNSGVISRESSPGIATIETPVLNNGTVSALSGQLNFSNTFNQGFGDLIVDDGAGISFASLTNLNGGNIVGDGVVANNSPFTIAALGMNIDPIGNPLEVINNGDLPTPGELQFFGDYSFDASSIFFFDIFGPDPTDYDRIVFTSGTADLTAEPDLGIFGDSSILGTISPSDVLTIFSGAYTGQFAFLPDGSLVNVFDNFSFDYLGDFEIQYGPGVIQLTNFNPVPEPQTWAMMALGAVLIGAWARRRLQRR